MSVEVEMQGKRGRLEEARLASCKPDCGGLALGLRSEPLRVFGQASPLVRRMTMVTGVAGGGRTHSPVLKRFCPVRRE